MTKLYNIGCSFSYGNCAFKKNQLCDTHLSPGIMFADHLGVEECNIASTGLSLDGVLRRLYTFDFEPHSYFLVGLPPSNRFQVAATKLRNQRKVRGLQANKPGVSGKIKKASSWQASKSRKYAFTKGPLIPDDWFHTYDWIDISLKNLDIDEHLNYYAFFYIVLIQARLAQLGKFWLYNTVEPHMSKSAKHPEVLKLKNSIVQDNSYYEPTSCMWEPVIADSSLQVADDDTHPNHEAYKLWFEGFKRFSDV